MGVCTSSEAKPEKDLYSDGLAKEHFNKEVLGRNSDSSIGIGYVVFSIYKVFAYCSTFGYVL